MPTGGDHRFGSLVDGLDDLGAVDSAEISGGDREAGVTELELDRDQRDALARHLRRVRVAKLLRRQPATQPGRDHGVVQLFVKLQQQPHHGRRRMMAQPLFGDHCHRWRGAAGKEYLAEAHRSPYDPRAMHGAFEGRAPGSREGPGLATGAPRHLDRVTRILALQSAIGNRRFARMLTEQAGAAPPPAAAPPRPLAQTLQRHLVVGSTAADTKQYTDYTALPATVKSTVDKVAGSNAKYNEMPDWIAKWQVWLRMKSENDEATLIKTADLALKDTRVKTWEDPKYGNISGYKVYGMGTPAALPGGQSAFRGSGVPIQDRLNDAVWAPNAPRTLTDDEPREFAEFLDASRYGPGARNPTDKAANQSFGNRRGVPDVGKACKGGLCFHTRSRRNPSEIFFDLSGLDLYKILTDRGKTVRGAITGQELRSLYRQWLKWIEGKGLSEVDFDHVHFTYLGHEVNPPWVDDPELFSLYTPRFVKSTPPPSGKRNLL